MDYLNWIFPIYWPAYTPSLLSTSSSGIDVPYTLEAIKIAVRIYELIGLILNN